MNEIQMRIWGFTQMVLLYPIPESVLHASPVRAYLKPNSKFVLYGAWCLSVWLCATLDVHLEYVREWLGAHLQAAGICTVMRVDGCAAIFHIFVLRLHI